MSLEKDITKIMEDDVFKPADKDEVAKRQTEGKLEIRTNLDIYMPVRRRGRTLSKEEAYEIIVKVLDDADLEYQIYEQEVQ